MSKVHSYECLEIRAGRVDVATFIQILEDLGFKPGVYAAGTKHKIRSLYGQMDEDAEQAVDWVDIPVNTLVLGFGPRSFEGGFDLILDEEGLVKGFVFKLDSWGMLSVIGPVRQMVEREIERRLEAAKLEEVPIAAGLDADEVTDIGQASGGKLVYVNPALLRAHPAHGSASLVASVPNLTPIESASLQAHLKRRNLKGVVAVFEVPTRTNGSAAAVASSGPVITSGRLQTKQAKAGLTTHAAVAPRNKIIFAYNEKKALVMLVHPEFKKAHPAEVDNIKRMMLATVSVKKQAAKAVGGEAEVHVEVDEDGMLMNATVDWEKKEEGTGPVIEVIVAAPVSTANLINSQVAANKRWSHQVATLAVQQKIKVFG